MVILLARIPRSSHVTESGHNLANLWDDTDHVVIICLTVMKTINVISGCFIQYQQ